MSKSREYGNDSDRLMPYPHIYPPGTATARAAKTKISGRPKIQMKARAKSNSKLKAGMTLLPHLLFSTTASEPVSPLASPFITSRPISHSPLASSAYSCLFTARTRALRDNSFNSTAFEPIFSPSEVAHDSPQSPTYFPRLRSLHLSDFSSSLTPYHSSSSVSNPRKYSTSSTSTQSRIRLRTIEPANVIIRPLWTNRGQVPLPMDDLTPDTGPSATDTGVDVTTGSGTNEPFPHTQARDNHTQDQPGGRRLDPQAPRANQSPRSTRRQHRLTCPHSSSYDIITSFFRLAAKNGDVALTESIFDFCMERQVWDSIGCTGSVKLVDKDRGRECEDRDGESDQVDACGRVCRCSVELLVTYVITALDTELAVSGSAYGLSADVGAGARGGVGSARADGNEREWDDRFGSLKAKLRSGHEDAAGGCESVHDRDWLWTWEWAAPLIRGLIGRFLENSRVYDAYGLFRYVAGGSRHGVGETESLDAVLPVAIVRRLCKGLVKEGMYEEVLGLSQVGMTGFQDLSDSANGAEVALGYVLDDIKRKRLERVDRTLASRLGEMVLHSITSPGLQERSRLHTFTFQRSLQNFITVLIRSGLSVKAMQIIHALHRHQVNLSPKASDIPLVPPERRPRFLNTVTMLLLRHQQTYSVQGLVRLVPQLLPQHHADPLLDRVALVLARQGAHEFASKLLRSRTARLHSSPSTSLLRRGDGLRNLTSHAIGFRLRHPTPHDVGKALAIYRQRRSAAPKATRRRHATPLPSTTSKITSANGDSYPSKMDITHLVSILVNSRDIRAAKKLLSVENAKLDDKTRTTICNTILHGMVKNGHHLSGRQVRHVLNTRNAFMKQYNFRPDQVTMNVQVKALLLWKMAFTTERVKVLFNLLVRDGNWVQERWRRFDGYPFELDEDYSSHANTYASKLDGRGSARISDAVCQRRTGVPIRSDLDARRNGESWSSSSSILPHNRSSTSPTNLHAAAAVHDPNTDSQTALMLPGGLGLPAIPKDCSFQKHVRPLYKMFVKAFYLRGDVDAARTVVGILKDEEAVQRQEREKREKARMLGRLKKKRREGGNM
ncbi:hypothetical protein AX16_010174 [Volvariella volvacea WC 439]|nr:hypothetical protein AX16_010174 [Volvariella volvacea WC 439]